MAENLESALEQFNSIIEDLGENRAYSRFTGNLKIGWEGIK
jgi:hypothetical protein